MPPRKPLVIINGRTQQLPAGDTLDAATSEVDVVPLTNGGSTAATICTAVYISSGGAFQMALASASGTTDAIGLVRDASIGTGATGAVQTDGVLNATATQWDNATGQTGGLTPGANYYVSPTTAGKITAVAPSATGQFVAKIGRALSATSLDISIHEGILL